MAEGVLFNIAGGIIKSLAPLVADEIGLSWGVQNELEKLQGTIWTIKGVLLHAEKLRDGNPGIKNWLERLNDVVYDADDLLDAVSTASLQRQQMTQDEIAKKVCIFHFRSNKLSFGTCHKIKKITMKLDAIKADKPFLLEDCHEETRVKNWRRDTHSFLVGEIVIGREDDKQAIVDRLLGSNVEGNVSIVPIIGIGGLGKTTLAKLIFHDEKIQKNFKLKMWICVSDDFDVKVIIKKILELAERDPKISGDLPGKINVKEDPRKEKLEKLLADLLKEKKERKDTMEELVGDLLEVIKETKYLLVLDDVWNDDKDKWSSLINPLMGGAKGSKVLITTRKESVARMMQTEPHRLVGLSKHASWELFKQVAFENGIGWESFEDTGREILKKCRGVPLAVKTVGRLLQSKSLEVWQEFVNKELLKIPQEESDIFPTLKLSYNELSSHLKHCFAYCSLFPKDYEYDKATLINLWIAQGYVESEENQCLEDVGNEYFMSLLWRSFFQEARMDEFGNIIGCKMHDLMHDLAILVAGPLIITFPFKKNINYKRTRHVTVTYDISSSTELSSLYKASRTRTFLCPTMNDYSQFEIDCKAILKSFKLLHVLDLSKRNLKYVPSSISKLRHLRYLDLSENKKIKRLPSSISMLVNLQNLCLCGCSELIKLPRFRQLVNLRHFDVSFCEKIRSLPSDISRLVNLKHLKIENCGGIKYLPHGIRQLTNLQVLTNFVVSSGSFYGYSSGLAELNGLNKLKGHLTISGLSCGKGFVTEYNAANLKAKASLNSLLLQWRSEGVVNDCDDDMSLEGLQPHQNLKHLELLSCWCPRHPSWLPLLTSLVSLSLDGCSKWQYLAPLSHLPSLQSLKIYNINGLEYVSNGGEWNDYSQLSIPRTFFPSLKEVDLRNCPNLKGWWEDFSREIESLFLLLVSMKFFPSLTKIHINKCPNMKGWWGNSLDEVQSLLCSFPFLSKLQIESSKSLSFDGPVLTCRKVIWESLQQTLMMIASSTFASSLGTTFSKLREIIFENISDLEVLPEELKCLNSLQILKFEDCDKLKSLYPGIQHLTTIKVLSIDGCPMFDHEDEMQWPSLKNLLSLSFENLPKMSSLPLGLKHVTTLKELKISTCESLMTLSPILQHLTRVKKLYISNCPMSIEEKNEMQWQELKSLLSLSFFNLWRLSFLPLGLQHVTTLKTLHILNCEKLTTIPEWIHQCQVLEELKIWECSNLASLPVGTCEPWSLRTLSIWNCPILFQKCEETKGEYWPKIAHIPELFIDGPELFF